MTHEFDDEADIVLEANWEDFKIKPLEGDSLKRAEEYLEKLKKLRPEEYKRIMEENNPRKKKKK